MKTLEASQSIESMKTEIRRTSGRNLELHFIIQVHKSANSGVCPV